MMHEKSLQTNCVTVIFNDLFVTKDQKCAALKEIWGSCSLITQLSAFEFLLSNTGGLKSEGLLDQSACLVIRLHCLAELIRNVKMVYCSADPINYRIHLFSSKNTGWGFCYKKGSWCASFGNWNKLKVLNGFQEAIDMVDQMAELYDPEGNKLMIV